jgi:hypothetical protein
LEIKYATRSEFLEPCINKFQEQEKELLSGKTIQVILKSGGYDKEVILNIDSNNSSVFNTVNWHNKDSTRFPVRIKAAATALLRLKYCGQFKINHQNGVLTISLLSTTSR